ncbi:MAG TPA: UbiX family flavin prenyltransferase [Candidatus Methylacidiphilales bacterium]|nr:UbiX family flavin prenyltransferase [Candidatus Methylacidiphilales bacterium]
MKLVMAITGASGSLYAQRLLQVLRDDPGGPHEVHVALSRHAREVAQAEVGKLTIPAGFTVHGDDSMQVPYVSGSAHFDGMVIIPCSMGTIGRIAHGYSDSAIVRAADVFLKEKRKLILVPRETPWNLIQARNIVAVMEAGADLIPAMPAFYHRPETVLDLVDTVVARVLDHLGLDHALTKRWMEKPSQE